LPCLAARACADKAREKDPKYLYIKYLLAAFTMFILEEPAHPGGTPFPGRSWMNGDIPLPLLPCSPEHGADLPGDAKPPGRTAPTGVSCELLDQLQGLNAPAR